MNTARLIRLRDQRDAAATRHIRRWRDVDALREEIVDAQRRRADAAESPAEGSVWDAAAMAYRTETREQSVARHDARLAELRQRLADAITAERDAAEDINRHNALWNSLMEQLPAEVRERVNVAAPTPFDRPRSGLDHSAATIR